MLLLLLPNPVRHRLACFSGVEAIQATRLSVRSDYGEPADYLGNCGGITVVVWLGEPA